MIGGLFIYLQSGTRARDRKHTLLPLQTPYFKTSLCDQTFRVLSYFSLCGGKSYLIATQKKSKHIFLKKPKRERGRATTRAAEHVLGLQKKPGSQSLEEPVKGFQLEDDGKEPEILASRQPCPNGLMVWLWLTASYVDT